MEAESVAYIVCAGLDIDSSEYSFSYLAVWAGGGDEARRGISESAERNQRAALVILDPDVRRCLGSLRDSAASLRLALLTNGDEAQQRAKLARFDLLADLDACWSLRRSGWPSLTRWPSFASANASGSSLRRRSAWATGSRATPWQRSGPGSLGLARPRPRSPNRAADPGWHCGRPPHHANRGAR